jgi:hypothetical protein
MMPLGWVMLVEGAVMLMLVLALPPLTAAASVLRILQKYIHHAALAIGGSLAASHGPR